MENTQRRKDKQGYLENCLDECGGLRFNKDNIKVGYIVSLGHREQVEIISTGSVNVGFKILTGGAAGMTLTGSYAEIKEIIEAVEKTRADDPHPFKVGEQYEAVRREYPEAHSFKCVETKVMYEIIKASDTTIQLRPVGTDVKPITRKPAKTYSGKWRFSVDDVYGNTFYKESGENRKP